ncbi:MAG: hypothetical protein AAGA68_25990 [Pseudomonadota bacterium]
MADKGNSDWTFYSTWETFLRAAQKSLERQRGLGSTQQAIVVIDSLLDMKEPEFEKMLSDFSASHTDGLDRSAVFVGSEKVLAGLEAEMKDVTSRLESPLGFWQRLRNFFIGGAREFEAVEVLTTSLREVLEEVMPNWLANALTFLGEIFKLLALRGDAK